MKKKIIAAMLYIFILTLAFTSDNVNIFVRAADIPADFIRGDKNDYYISLDKIMTSEGYYLSDKSNITYKKDETKTQPGINITFDTKKNLAYKNEFYFDIKNCVKSENGVIYIKKEKLEDILNVDIKVNNNSFNISPVFYTAHEWINMCERLIAHAGGCVRKDYWVPNCREGVVNSYNNGHRVFELDFNLTTDGKLAVVHDWDGYSGMKSSDEWKKRKIYDVFTSMMLDDVLDIMLVNKDMFLITDTKSFEYTKEQIEEQFKILVETAKKKDPSLKLLNRIIPQIYNRPMYDIIMKQHDFISVIYTLYASNDTSAQVLDFIKKHDNIPVVTMSPPKNTDSFIKRINEAGKYAYVHTFNELSEITEFKRSGIWGIYTDFIYPSDLTAQAFPATSKVILNGKEIIFDAYNINDNNYFKLRDLAYAMSGTKKEFDVSWDGKNNAVLLISGKSYTKVGGEMAGKSSTEHKAVLTMSKIYLDGKEINLTAYNIRGNNYFKLRDIGQALNFGVTWDSKNDTVKIDTGKSYTLE